MKKIIVYTAVGLLLSFSSISQAGLVFGFTETELMGLTKHDESPPGQTLAAVELSTGVGPGELGGGALRRSPRRQGDQLQSCGRGLEADAKDSG